MCMYGWNGVRWNFTYFRLAQSKVNTGIVFGVLGVAKYEYDDCFPIKDGGPYFYSEINIGIVFEVADHEYDI